MKFSQPIAVVVAVLGIAGLGVASAAIEGGDGAVVSEEPTTTTAAPGTTTTTTTTTSGAPVTTTPGADVGGTLRSTEGCNGGTFKNHGDFVSSVAHTPGSTGADVSAAAQSPCGKPIQSTTTTAPTTTTSPTTTTTLGSTGSTVTEPTGPGNGHGKAKGHNK